MSKVIKKTGGNQDKKSSKFSIDCSKPVEDKVFKVKDFSEFLKNRIKVKGELHKLEDKVDVRSEDKNVVVEAQMALSKRYLKYLTKKYLKKHKLREYLFVAATSKSSYEIRYFNIPEEEGADE